MSDAGEVGKCGNKELKEYCVENNIKFEDMTFEDLVIIANSFSYKCYVLVRSVKSLFMQIKMRI